MPPPRVPELRNIRLVLPTESRLAGYPASLSLSLSSTFGRQDRRRPLVLSSLSPSLLRPPIDAFLATWSSALGRVPAARRRRPSARTQKRCKRQARPLASNGVPWHPNACPPPCTSSQPVAGAKN